MEQKNILMENAEFYLGHFMRIEYQADQANEKLPNILWCHASLNPMFETWHV